MKVHPINALHEKDVDEIIDRSGGRRAHEDADRRGKVGADYVLGGTVIELKMLDEEGLGKRERQERIADLFRDSQPNRPVVILDERLLSEAGLRKYRNAVERPITRNLKGQEATKTDPRGEWSNEAIDSLDIQQWVLEP